MAWQLSKTGCLLMDIQRFVDGRGYFSEVYRYDEFHKIHGVAYGRPAPVFIQNNLSFSGRNVVRGMHYQMNQTQGKYVRVMEGSVVDVVIDLRKSSKTYGMLESFELNIDNHALYIPPGFAHGFWAKRSVLFFYQCTDLYDKASDRSISPTDKSIDFPWHHCNEELVISDKDKQGSKWGGHVVLLQSCKN